MSFFDGEVIAKEQLSGAVGVGVVPSTVPVITHGGGVVLRRKPSPLSLIITPDGQVLLNLDIQKRERN